MYSAESRDVKKIKWNVSQDVEIDVLRSIKIYERDIKEQKIIIHYYVIRCL